MISNHFGEERVEMMKRHWQWRGMLPVVQRGATVSWEENAGD